MPWPLPPLPSLLPTTLIAIVLDALALFVAALIIRHMFSLFVVARRHGPVVIDALLPANTRPPL
jgi:hypothetical protein